MADKTDSSTTVTVTDTDCIPACTVLLQLLSLCCWRSCVACQNTQSSEHYWTAVPVTSDLCNPRRTVTAMPGNPASRPAGVWRCIFTVSSVCLHLPQNTAGLSPHAWANSQDCKTLNDISELNTAAADNICHTDYVQIAAYLQNG